MPALFAGCIASPPAPSALDIPITTPPAEVVIAAGERVKRPPFEFSGDDQRLLTDVQHGAFLYLWNECSPTTGMVYDRSSVTVVSVAGVGFQLSAIPIAISRGWISREEGQARTLLILRSLVENPRNRKEGLYYHYLDPKDAGPSEGGYEHVVSTIDSAILLAGVLTAGSYFGDEVGKLADSIFTEANWKFFVWNDEAKPHESGFVSLGWKPADNADPTGKGELLPFVWADSGDEHRLVSFLAACAPREEHRLGPEVYYRLRRGLGSFGDTGPLVWFPWSGALFTSFFAHCWIDYAHAGVDDPAAFGQAHRARVDWWENSRRMVRLHQLKAIVPKQPLAQHKGQAWGLTASDAPSGYAVPGVFPKAWPMTGARREFDFSPFVPKDDFGDGTVAPYGAGCSIMFDPVRSVETLHWYQDLKGPDGKALVWREPDAAKKQYGFQDAFNIEKNWVAPDCVAIDQGPMILAIENARTGMIWRAFTGHRFVRGGLSRLGLSSQLDR